MSGLSDVSLRPIEIASGLVFGVENGDGAAEASVPSLDRVRDRLETAVLSALGRPPCLVSFSGGRDSSAVLGLASRVARREGLPLPIPATLRFADLPEADESEWQERVVEQLGLEDWLRLDPGADLDVVGPVARAVLERHGLLWPFNAYVHLPLIESARGGSLLTGIGGDELLGQLSPPRWHAVIARRVRPRPRDVLGLGLALAPWRVRRRVLRRRDPLALPWLTAEGVRQLADARAAEVAREPRRLAARAVWWSRKRALRVVVRSVARLALDHDVELQSPLASVELARWLQKDPAVAYAGRAVRLEILFGDLLPREVYERRTKASFNRAFFGPWARALVESWDGEGVDRALVDADALRAAWSQDVPDGRSFTLLQSLWLRSGSRGEAPSLLPESSTP